LSQKKKEKKEKRKGQRQRVIAGQRENPGEGRKGGERKNPPIRTEGEGKKKTSIRARKLKRKEKKKRGKGGPPHNVLVGRERKKKRITVVLWPAGPICQKEGRERKREASPLLKRMGGKKKKA